MDITNPYSEPIKPSPGEEQQKLAAYASRWIHETFSIQLDQDALATLFSNLSSHWPVLKTIAKGIVSEVER